MNIIDTFFLNPLINLLILFYQLFFDNMGLAIIALSIVIRLVLLPVVAKQLKAAQGMKKLAPELEKLKKKYANDKQAFAQAQLKLYKEHGANPASGCLPTIIQLLVLFALFQALNRVLQGNGDVIERLNNVLYPFLRLDPGAQINTRFLYLDITKPDTILIPWAIKVFNFTIDRIPGLFLIAAAIAQLISSKMMMPKTDPIKTAQNKAKSKSNTEDMGSMMQSQMMFLAPIMTLVIGFRFASGLVLYWLSFSLFMVAQQIYLKKKES